MDYPQAVFLALLQGLTEFLPISSSAHLILPARLLDWPDQGLAFDVTVHLGTLLAVLWYFRGEVQGLVRGFFRQLAGERNADGDMAISLLIASLPIIPVAYLAKDIIESELRSTLVIAVTTIGFGLLLLAADKLAHMDKAERQLGWRDALIIGLVQCFALVPGTSRSGVTMTVALMLGYNRQAASRISFLLAIPTIAGAATLTSLDLVSSSEPVDWGVLFTGLCLAFVSAYACISFFLALINRIGFTPFVIYRLILGAVLLWLMFG